jgi:hypothetical protein
MGIWCDCDGLSGSDGGLRMALQICDIVSPHTGWPDVVQHYSHLIPDAQCDLVSLSCMTPQGD